VGKNSKIKEDPQGSSFVEYIISEFQEEFNALLDK
jgi:hypothetical protein